MAAPEKYLHVGAIILGASAALAVYLNFQGAQCLVNLSRASGGSPASSPPAPIFSQEQLAELQRNCFIITNSYVYSLFGVVIGAVLIVMWYAKKKKVRKGMGGDSEQERGKEGENGEGE